MSACGVSASKENTISTMEDNVNENAAELDEQIGSKVFFVMDGEILDNGYKYTVIANNQSGYNLIGFSIDITLLNDDGESITNKHFDYDKIFDSGSEIEFPFTVDIMANDYSIDWGYTSADILEETAAIEITETNYDGCDNSYHCFSFTVKNCTESVINSVGLNVNLLNESGDIVGTTYPQEPSRLQSGQSIVIDCLCEETLGACCAVVDGYSYYCDDEYFEGYVENAPVIEFSSVNELGNSEDNVISDNSTNSKSNNDSSEGMDNSPKSEAALLIATINDYTYEDVETLQFYIDEYWDYWNDENKEVALAALGHCMSEQYFEDEIREHLKSPKSFTLYSYEDSVVALDEKYSVTATIKYGATNSFGGEITNTLNAYIAYTVDIDRKKVEFVSFLCPELEF